MDWPDVVRACGDFAKQNGFAAFFLCLFMFLGYRVLMTLVRDVAKPASERLLNIADNVNERHDQFIDSTLASQASQGKCLEKLEETSVTHTKILDNHSTLLGQIYDQTKPVLSPPRGKRKC